MLSQNQIRRTLQKHPLLEESGVDYTADYNRPKDREGRLASLTTGSTTAVKEYVEKRKQIWADLRQVERKMREEGII